MIGKLKGILDEINTDHIILDVGGVGYKIYLSNRTIINLQLGVSFTFNIEMYVREDQMLLYGFSTKLEQKWFNILQTVQGVGSRVALSILSFLQPDQLYYAILSNDQKVIKSISGIGPKIAARIINELKNHPEILSNKFKNSNNDENVSSVQINNDVMNDALNALASLGFARSDILKVLTNINSEQNSLTLEEMIRLGLAKLVPNK